MVATVSTARATKDQIKVQNVHAGIAFRQHDLVWFSRIRVDVLELGFRPGVSGVGHEPSRHGRFPKGVVVVVVVVHVCVLEANAQVEPPPVLQAVPGQKIDALRVPVRIRVFPSNVQPQGLAPTVRRQEQGHVIAFAGVDLGGVFPGIKGHAAVSGLLLERRRRTNGHGPGDARNLVQIAGVVVAVHVEGKEPSAAVPALLPGDVNGVPKTAFVPKCVGWMIVAGTKPTKASRSRRIGNVRPDELPGDSSVRAPSVVGDPCGLHKIIESVGIGIRIRIRIRICARKECSDRWFRRIN
mmetsp:Transcript_15578/g.33672  ORF Transcript_15578/g.33672 Transcript_15578/m.33672 type:complete len:297 (+) Transcript_15578:2151-3041(+)